MHARGCTGTMISTHLLLAGNDTVPVSMHCGRGMRSAECLLISVNWSYAILYFKCSKVVRSRCQLFD